MERIWALSVPAAVHNCLPNPEAWGQYRGVLAVARSPKSACKLCNSLGQPDHDSSGASRCLPECCFLEAGIVSLSLPPDSTWTMSAASAFAHCEHLQRQRLPHKLRRIEQEAFLKCTSLKEVSILPDGLSPAAHSSANFTEWEKA